MDFPAVVLLAATLPAPRLKTLVLVLLLDTVWEFITKMSQSEVYDEWDALGGFLCNVRFSFLSLLMEIAFVYCQTSKINATTIRTSLLCHYVKPSNQMVINKHNDSFRFANVVSRNRAL